MKQSEVPLHKWHASNKAVFEERDGFQVPKTYGKLETEYGVLRNGVGIHDLCHEARIRVEGRDAGALMQRVLTRNAEKIAPLALAQSFICNLRGGIIDFVTVYRDKAFFLLLGKASQRRRLLEFLAEQQERFEIEGVQIADVSSTQRQVALLGPRAELILEQLTMGNNTQVRLEPGEGTMVTVGSAKVLVLKRPPERIAGLDLLMGSVYLQPVWERITEAARLVGGRPVGTEAIDMVRVESGIPGVGAEMTEDTTPLEVDRAQLVDFHKPYHTGRRAMMHGTLREFARTMVALRVEGGKVAKLGSEIFFDTMPVGRVTSTILSPVQRTGLALGMMSDAIAQPGQQVTVHGSDGQTHLAHVIKPGSLPR